MSTWTTGPEGHRVWYSARPGPPGAVTVLYIHGLGCAGSIDFSPVVALPELAPWGSICVDLLGYGESDRPEGFSYDLRDQAALLWRLVDDLGLREVALLGHSMGGNVALRMAQLRPASVTRLILCESNLLPGAGSLSGRVTAKGEAEFALEWERFLALFPPDVARPSWRQYSETLRKTTPLAMHRSARSLLAMAAEPGLLEEFARMPCAPRYLVSEEGGPDGGIPQRLAALGVPVFRVPRSGHGMMADNPGGFAEAVARCHRGGGTATDATPGTVGVSREAEPPRPVRPPSSELLFGRFEVLSELARGGMGIVYRVRQVDLGRVVALKLLKEGEEASAEQIERFHREAELAAQLRHPNIVPIHEVGVWQGRHFFTMDCIEGETLEARLRRGLLPIEQTASLLEKVARAIHFAHTKGIVHRDMKPGNVLLDEAGEPQITDFGLARSLEGPSTLTRPGAAIGTPFYMSPEQIAGRLDLIDARTDVFALGVVLYEMLSGKRPFTGESAVAIFQSITQEEPLPLRLAAPNAPRDLATICERALEKPREKRFPTALAMAEDLARYQRGEPVLAKPIGPLARWARRARRHPAFLAGAAAAVVCIAGAAFLAIRLEGRHASERRESDVALRASRYKALVAEGAYLVEQKDWDGAKKRFDEAIALDAAQPLAWKNRAWVHFEQKRYAEAMDDYTRALERDPRDGEAAYFRGCVKRDAGDREGALADVTSAIGLRPTEPRFRNARGCLLYDQGKDEEAIPDFDVAIREDRSEAEFCVNRALCHMRRGRLEQAERDFTMALDRDPRHDMALLDRAKMREGLGKLKEAVEDLARYVNFHPEDPEGFFLRGSYRIEGGQSAEGVLDLDESLRLRPGHWKSLLNRGLGHLALGHAAEASADFDGAIAAAPKEPEPYLKRSSLRIEAGQGIEALSDCDACLALDPDLAEARWNRALALEMVGRRDDAAAEWVAYLARWPEDPSAAEIGAKVEELRGGK
ncbi:MAG: alpha/beta fold hydrolase [Planctomycetota bacterium]